ncbi:hypothetical protein L9F63_011385 [Diploptera punctata]|uniref:Uncharacterized protein n=1 Tax=Diploptera punctata TaxID=6984 RepID=A0AAD8EQ47_DIPPU|nr:hypothetical protein L9F63_011385 [Diploptera punctata]
MVEITRNNFEDKFNEIASQLRSAVFIAVDNEFTGLLSDQDYKSSLFDSGSERYDKLRRNIEHFLVMEVGISAFQFVEDENKYVANTYTFYVFPRSFGSIETKFMCQASSLEFLYQHKFDFNKFVYEGVSYLNCQQEIKLRQELYEGSLFRHLERTISLDDEKLVQSGCSRVAEWCPSAVENDVLSLEYTTYCRGEKRLAYIIHKELRQRFHNIWTFPDTDKVSPNKVSQKQRDQFVDDTSLEDDMMNSLLGFSRIFNLLLELRKPIVGHNLLLDLMIMYNQFHKPLPSQFGVFKEKIHKLFPVVYDTKYLSFELRKLVRREDMWDTNVLSNLYYYFKNGRGKYIVLFSPLVELKERSNSAGSICTFSNFSTNCHFDKLYVDDVDHFHEAGWDSFCTGYCFIKMAHIFAHITCLFLLHSVMDGRLLSSRELLAAAYSRKNRVNLIRASVSHVCLDGPDPPSTRPKWLHVQTRGYIRPIDISKVAELFAKYGIVDVKPFSRYRALVAVGNHTSAKDILCDFYNHRELRVSWYRPLWHSPMLRIATWTTGLMCAYLLYRRR